MSATGDQPAGSGASTAPLACCRCGYDLSGLEIDTVCPECATEIQTSLHTAIESRYGTDPHDLPLPPWLRIARSAFIAALITLFSSPFALPEVSEWLGLPVVLGRHAQFNDAMAVCALCTFFFGIGLGIQLPAFRRVQGAAILLSAILLLVLCLPALGR